MSTTAVRTISEMYALFVQGYRTGGEITLEEWFKLQEYFKNHDRRPKFKNDSSKAKD